MLRSRRHWFRSGSLRPENLGHCLGFFVTAVLIYTIIAATYDAGDAFLQPVSEITALLSPESNSTDRKVAKAGCGVDEPINCGDLEVFQLLMSAAFDELKDVDFYRFGKPVDGDNGSDCHMMGWFKRKEGGIDKDYRSFRVSRSENCALSVVGIGDYHSGGNAEGKAEVVEKAVDVGEIVNGDELFEEPFSRGKYLIYAGGGERCKDMGLYLWGFTCMLGEAEFLNRTLVLDTSICLSKVHTSSGVDEEGRDFRSYFDFEQLKVTSSVVDQAEFWPEWRKWSERDGLKLHLVEDFRVTPMKLAEVNDSLIMRKFGGVEPDNFWFRVCEGEADAVIQRPWNKLEISRHLWNVAAAIISRMSWDYDGVRVERGEKAKNKELWPNLDNDTSPQSVMATLRGRGVEDGRRVYIATNEADTSFFDPLKERYSIQLLEDHRDLWDGDSSWDYEMRKLNNGSALEFDGYMRERVDDYVVWRGKKRIETFNDLTRDCRNGVNKC
ncbi:uncharacterized protein LOC131012735 [Salvia miltiorrhiza]|uniref:uncharacterized protein LOC131012735 n=1 Tax=Salvia miltiorrhiza TaxID=226208 RepID=UPI0025ACBBE1|nr:uncharacterized protein LOC131012735 [Salvia miltiorrhiza]